MLVKAQPVVKDLKSFANTAKPVSQSLDDLTASLDATGGVRSSADQCERAKNMTQGKHGATSRFLISLPLIIPAIRRFD